MIKLLRTKTFINLIFPKFYLQSGYHEKYYTTFTNMENDIITEENGNSGLIILNRPKALNALNLSMVHKIYDVLKKWEKNKEIVIIKGSGDKAFCAGGDVKHITLALKQPGGEQIGYDFFRHEYILNNLIGMYNKLYVAIIDGITMGGGVGLSVHGKYRVATERTIFAMPETAIGLFPDVGGSYFLPRLSGKLGLFLGLTGYRLKAEDVKLAGIATHFIHSSKLNELIKVLLICNQENVGIILNNLESKDQSKDFSLNKYIEKINKCFSGNSIEEIILRLKQDNSQWANDVLQILSKMSPTSLKITKKAIDYGTNFNLSECLKMEYRLSCRACHIESDFYEGVRSVLIDKDYNPIWKPKTLEEITNEFIHDKFKLLPEGKELQL